ncbi:hypothetical protein D3C73_1594930 [compost metagenome]
MIHHLVIRYAEEFIGLEFEYKFLFCFSISILLSALMFRFYEEPSRKLLRYGIKKRDQKIRIKQNLTKGELQQL